MISHVHGPFDPFCNVLLKIINDGRNPFDDVQFLCAILVSRILQFLFASFALHTYI